jgi:hypothetical protein
MQTLILWPLVAQVALTFALLLWLGPLRIAAVRRGEVKLADVALGQDAWPQQITQIGRSYSSQLELPLLFYLVVVLALVTASSGGVMVWLAWAFVATRIVHAFIHTSSNNVRHRFNAFLAGVAVLIGMWVVLALRLAGLTG